MIVSPSRSCQAARAARYPAFGWENRGREIHHPAHPIAHRAQPPAPPSVLRYWPTPSVAGLRGVRQLSGGKLPGLLRVARPSRFRRQTCRRQRYIVTEEDDPQRPPRPEKRATQLRCRRLAERDNGSWPALLGSVDLHVGRPDHLAPLLGFFGDELAEVSRRSCKRHGAQVGKPPTVGKSGSA